MKILIIFLTFFLSGCVAHVSENALVRAASSDRILPDISPDGVWKINPISLQLDSNTTLRGAVFSKPKSIATVLYFGGNGFVLSKHFDYLLSVYGEQPVDLVIFDHRGYGSSTGTASLDAIISDGLSTYDHVRAMASTSGKPLIVHGQSLGSFIAGDIASHRVLSALILESSATTAEEWVQGFVDNSLWVRKGVVESTLKGKGNAGVMARLNEPVLIVVGKNDTTTRPGMSESLFRQANLPASSKELLVVVGAGHNNAAKSADFNSAFSRLLTRIQE